MCVVVVVVGWVRGGCWFGCSQPIRMTATTNLLVGMAVVALPAAYLLVSVDGYGAAWSVAGLEGQLSSAVLFYSNHVAAAAEACCSALVVSCAAAVQVLNYALSMHGVVGDAAKLKSGSAGAAFRAEVAQATARATGARWGTGQAAAGAVTAQLRGQQ